ncbi:hypothetical protein [Ruegeria sp. HKCCD6428]|uniref:hypothetical protein n=1 Tax=Ruegeria sp. HKCCD6428 TaxID=2683002 RepID=UPI001490F5C3|nr:hypothetical protein [Ruegeria sp. HKCCD6428]NOC84535.1 hypothetical protein [Ruegeria sp. HKCCD6428]
MTETADTNEWWINEDIENYDWRYSPLSNAFADALLLSFIRAHPPQKPKKGQSEGTRLRDAREAVFGIAPRGYMRTMNDVPELLEMARQYIHDRGGQVDVDSDGNLVWGETDWTGCRSHDELAEHALERKKLAGGPKEIAAPQSRIDRLAAKFEGDLKNLILTARYQEEAAILISKLKDLRSLLGPTGIPMQLPADPMRDLKAPF